MIRVVETNLMYDPEKYGQRVMVLQDVENPDAMISFTVFDQKTADHWFPLLTRALNEKSTV